MVFLVLLGYYAININDDEFDASKLIGNNQFINNSNSIYNIDIILSFKVFNALINSIILDFGTIYYVRNNENKFENFIFIIIGKTLEISNSAIIVYN